jgi:hypothetical protein
MNNTLEITEIEELVMLKKKLKNIKRLVEALVENGQPKNDPIKESTYYCAEMFLESELKNL